MGKSREMLAGQTPYYFKTIRKISVAFGSIFNNIYIQRFDENGNAAKTIRVPLTYASGQKWYVIDKQNVMVGDGIPAKMSYPRIGFELTGMRYDAQRKLNTLGAFTKRPVIDSNSVLTADQLIKQLNPVPYDFSFDVHIATKNVDDVLQIIEQIIPYFTPSFNLNVTDIPELAIVKDIPVIFSGDIGINDDYEGSFDQVRVIVWTLSFVVKGYIYPPIGDAEIIKKVIATIYQNSDMTDTLETVQTQVVPIDAEFADDWDVETTIT